MCDFLAHGVCTFIRTSWLCEYANYVRFQCTTFTYIRVRLWIFQSNMYMHFYLVYSPQCAHCVSSQYTVCACVRLYIINYRFIRALVSYVRTLMCVLCMFSMHSMYVFPCVYICIRSQSNVIVYMHFYCPIRSWNYMYTVYIHSQFLCIFCIITIKHMMNSDLF